MSFATMVPESLSGLSDDEILNLKRSLKAAVKEALDADPDDETVEAATEAMFGENGGMKRLERETNRRKALAASSAPEPVEPEVVEDELSDDSTDETNDDEADDDDTDDEGDEEGASELGTRRTPTALSTGAQPDPTPEVRQGPRIVVHDESVFSGPNPSWTDLSQALLNKHNRAYASAERYDVAHIDTRRPGGAGTLTDSASENYRKLSAPVNDDLTAALCGPTFELLDMAYPAIDTSRTVTNSIPGYDASAAKVSVHQAPKYSDVADDLVADNAIGKWTSAEDAVVASGGTSAEKGCWEVPCNNAVDFELYAVWSCLQVPNLMQISFPQLITRFQEIGLAAHSQFADDLALAFIKAADAEVYRDGDGTDNPAWSVLTRVLRTLVRARAEYVQKERLVGSVAYDVWMPKVLAAFFQADIISRKTADGSIPNATVSDVESAFSRYGFDVHWYHDPTATISTTAGGAFVEVANQDLLLRAAPKGKFRFIDKGRLTVGVMGNGGLRDSTLVSQNRFRVFFETFETVIDTMSAPAMDISIHDACANGAVIADVALDCLGAAAA